jgi:hypothetical protein
MLEAWGICWILVWASLLAAGFVTIPKNQMIPDVVRGMKISGLFVFVGVCWCVAVWLAHVFVS